MIPAPSALDLQGPQAARIAALGWAMVLLAGLVCAIVLGLLLCAVLRRRTGRVDLPASGGADRGALWVGLIMNLVVQAWAWLGYFNRWRHLAVQNTALWWYFLAANGVLTCLVLYISPRLIG